jgi:uncharacterized protein
MSDKRHLWDAWLVRLAPLTHLRTARILILSIVFSIVGGYFASDLIHNLKTDLAELLPESFQSVKTLRRIEERLGGLGNLRLAIECPDLNVAIEYAETILAPALLKSPIVNYLDYKNDIAFYKQYGLLYMEVDELYDMQEQIENRINKEKQRLNPFMVDDLFGSDEEDESEEDDGGLQALADKYSKRAKKEYHVNADSTLMVMDVYPTGTSGNVGFARKLLAEVRGIIAETNPSRYHPQLTVECGGNFKNKIDEYETILGDILNKALPGLLSIILLIMIFFFVQYRPDNDKATGGRLANRILVAVFAAVVISIPLIMSLLWTFGVTALVIGNLNTITSFLFVILFGLGIDFGIHIFARYMEGRNRGEDYRKVLETTIVTTGKALATTALTTSVAFFALTITEFRGFSELGFIAGTGVLFALIAMVAVLPAMIALGEQLHLVQIRRQTRPQDDTVVITRGSYPMAKPVLLAGAILTVFLGWHALQIEFEYDFTNLRSNLPETIAFKKKTVDIFDLAQSPAVVLCDNEEDIRAVTSVMERHIEEDTETPTIETVRSVLSLVPDDQDEKLDIIFEIHDLITGPDVEVLSDEDMEKVEELQEFTAVEETFTIEEVPFNIKRRFIGKDGEVGHFAFLYPDVPLRNGRNAILFSDDVRKIETDDGKIFYASSSNVIFADMLLVMMRDGKIAVVATLLVVFLLLWWDFGRIRYSLQVLTPLVVGVIWMLGIMSLAGTKLNFFNIVVVPAILGIGIDNGVHIFHRYMQEGRRSLPFVLRHTGLAISMTSVTTAQGFSGLVFAWHAGLQAIGSLALIGIGCAFLTAVTMLPAWLQTVEDKEGGPA